MKNFLKFCLKIHSLTFCFSYELVSQIGRGNFACVWKAYHKLSPAIHVAIKVIDKTQRSGQNKQKISQKGEYLFVIGYNLKPPVSVSDPCLKNRCRFEKNSSRNCYLETTPSPQYHQVIPSPRIWELYFSR